jgi:hypothetical protein
MPCPMPRRCREDAALRAACQQLTWLAMRRREVPVRGTGRGHLRIEPGTANRP